MASLIGTTIEWYDFFLYGSAAALVFNKLFFPRSTRGRHDAGLRHLCGGLRRAAGRRHRLRPFRRPDRRKRLLMLSLILMGVATVLIGLLPTYAQIGIWAPIGLIVLRLVQGFAVGGEWGGAVLIVAEHGDAARRGFWASWPQAGVPAGNLLSAACWRSWPRVQTEADFLDWGWRVPFLLSALLVVVGWYIRNRVAESPMFERSSTRPRRRPRSGDRGLARATQGACPARRGPARRREHLLLRPHRLLADHLVDVGPRAAASRSTRC